MFSHQSKDVWGLINPNGYIKLATVPILIGLETIDWMHMYAKSITEYTPCRLRTFLHQISKESLVHLEDYIHLAQTDLFVVPTDRSICFRYIFTVGHAHSLNLILLFHFANNVIRNFPTLLIQRFKF